MRLELAPTEPDDDLWVQEVARPTPLRHKTFSGCFNIEYWSAELFGPPSDDDPHKKVFEVQHDAGRVGMIEVSAYNGQHLEPFDRLVLLALMGLWHDQGCDPQGRIAFSHHELFRRLDMKVGGRQSRAVKAALDRLRRCFVTQKDSFVVRTKKGEVVPVEREEDPFTLLLFKRGVKIGEGKNQQDLYVCQLGEAVLSGLADDFLQPRIAAEHLRHLKAKMPHAILLHGYFNGRLRPGEQRRFLYEELARVLRMRARHRSTLKARLSGPLKKLEDAGAIKVLERKQDHVTVALALEEEIAPSRPSEPNAFTLFDHERLRTQPQIQAAFFTLGVKIERVLAKVGAVSEKTLWALLEEMRVRTWRDPEEAESFVLDQIEQGYEPPKGYVPANERFRKRS